MMTTSVKDVLTRTVVVLLLLARQSRANDENKEWLWRILSSLEDEHQAALPESGERGQDHKLQDFISRDSQLSLEPSSLADLQQQSSSPYSPTRDNQLPMKRGFSGLLCCNHPPTKPPSTKRGENDERFKQWLLAQLFGEKVSPTHSSHSSHNPHTLLTEDAAYPGYIAASSSPRREDRRFWPRGEDDVEQHSAWRKRQVTSVMRAGANIAETGPGQWWPD